MCMHSDVPQDLFAKNGCCQLDGPSVVYACSLRFLNNIRDNYAMPYGISYIYLETWKAYLGYPKGNMVEHLWGFQIFACRALLLVPKLSIGYTGVIMHVALMITHCFPGKTQCGSRLTSSLFSYASIAQTHEYKSDFKLPFFPYPCHCLYIRQHHPGMVHSMMLFFLTAIISIITLDPLSQEM